MPVLESNKFFSLMISKHSLTKWAFAEELMLEVKIFTISTNPACYTKSYIVVSLWKLGLGIKKESNILLKCSAHSLLSN